MGATCSLDDGCNIDEFDKFCDQHPNRKVVVYANTSAQVKARADWMVTSGSAVKVIKHLHNSGEQILWAPDKHLGGYVKSQSDVDMILWDGACVVHEQFKAEALIELKKHHPDAAILVHPESPAEIVALADAVGSTSQLIKAAQTMPNKKVIVATDRGIFYKMQQLCPEKEFFAAPTAGEGASCKSCAHCPWMAMNGLKAIEEALIDPQGKEVFVDMDLREGALKSLNRMLDFTASMAK